MKLTRRVFCSMLGLLGLGAPALAKSQPIANPNLQGYFYDWNGINAPSTNDPRYQGSRRLTGGKHNQVFLDGVDVSKKLITWIVTGEDGWIEEFAQDKEDKWVLNSKGDDFLREVTRGRVEYRDLRYS